MPALLSSPAYEPGLADNLYATALLDGPLPLLSPGSVEKSGQIDQAYSEYRNLCAAGVEVDPDAFCARFPAYQTSLRRLVEVRRELEANPNLCRALDRWPSPGDRIYGFQLDRELGRGAFARVFLAREEAVGNRQVVVKVSLHADDEAGTLGKFNHPNVVTIHSARFDPETGFAVVCMPYLGSSTLLPVIESLAAKKIMPGRADFLLNAAHDECFPADNIAPAARALRCGSYLDGVLYLGERLASALAYVHERGILHRDLKPSNVLLCPNGEPVLIDFNLAYDRSITEHRLGGTLPYMPPEQLEAMTHKRGAESMAADNRADLYALGVLLYELLTGVHPFGPVPLKLKTADARDFLLGRQRQGPRPLRVRNRSIDPALDALIVRCLSHDPAGRPATAREMVAELRRLQAPIRRARRWVVAHAKVVAAAGVLVTSGTAFGVEKVATMPSAAIVHKEKADQLYRDGKYQEAIEQYFDSLEANDNQPEVKFALSQTHQKLGEALYKDGKYHAAVANFNLALHYNDQQPAVHFGCGRAYLKLGSYVLALKEFEATKGTDRARASACMGYCFSLLDVPHKAAMNYQAAVAAGYTNAAVTSNLSFCLVRTGDFAEAEAKATEALDLSPNLRAAFYNRGVARFQQWQRTHESALALDGLQDLREAINRGVATANSGALAATLAAAVLNDRLGDPKADPLYAEGASFLKMAVQNGYSRSCLGASPDNLKCFSEWGRDLPPDMKVEHRPNGLDTQLLLVDPIID